MENRFSPMSIFKFDYNDFTCSIQGINGDVVQSSSDADQTMAQSCFLEIVETETLRKWKKCIKMEDLDGINMKEIYHLVAAIQNALYNDTPTVQLSIEFSHMASGNISMILTLPVFYGSVQVKFELEEIEQDELTVMKLCFDLLTTNLRKEKKAQALVQKERKFGRCGANLTISRCGKIVANKVDSTGTTAIVSEKMSSGIYYAEFMSVRMNTNKYLYCGVLPSSATNLDSNLYSLDGGFCIYACNGYAYKYGNGGSGMTTNLQGCSGMYENIIVGVLLNLNDNKIQFSLNGMESESLDIDSGEYSFAVSLNTLWESVKLLNVEKEK